MTSSTSTDKRGKHIEWRISWENALSHRTLKIIYHEKGKGWMVSFGISNSAKFHLLEVANPFSWKETKYWMGSCLMQKSTSAYCLMYSDRIVCIRNAITSFWSNVVCSAWTDESDLRIHIPPPPFPQRTELCTQTHEKHVKWKKNTVKTFSYSVSFINYDKLCKSTVP